MIPGIGKTSHVYALGQIFIEGTGGGGLEHKQLIQLDPSIILSSTNHQGDLEYIVRSDGRGSIRWPYYFVFR